MLDSEGMDEGRERRRSPRTLLGAPAKVHAGAETLEGMVRDVSNHGMGLALNLTSRSQLSIGDLVWIIAGTVAPYAITATVVRSELDGDVGVEFEEILHGESLDALNPVEIDDESKPGDALN
ncbi:MAG: PilZ domain-containing protein [Deltaproteobacteria bacterium]|nr:PilZ domain-containing protein [Deltaproteobacteria bacterium]